MCFGRGIYKEIHIREQKDLKQISLGTQEHLLKLFCRSSFRKNQQKTGKELRSFNSTSLFL